MNTCDNFSSYAIRNRYFKGPLNSFSSKGISRSPIALGFMLYMLCSVFGIWECVFVVQSREFDLLQESQIFFPSMKQLHDFKSMFES